MEEVRIKVWWYVARCVVAVNRACAVGTAPLFVARKRAMFRKTAESLERGGMTDKAIAYYEKLLRKKPHDLDAHLAIGRCYLRKYALQEASEHIAYVLGKKPRCAEANLYQGIVSFYLNDKVRAKTCLERVVDGGELDSKKSSMALEYLGELTLGEGRHEEAIRLLERAIGAYPRSTNSVKRWILLAEAHHMKGDDVRAVTYLQKAIEENPRSAHAWNDLGVLLWSNGNAAHARKCFETALAIDPRYIDASRNVQALKDARHHAP